MEAIGKPSPGPLHAEWIAAAFSRRNWLLLVAGVQCLAHLLALVLNRHTLGFIGSLAVGGYQRALAGGLLDFPLGRRGALSDNRLRGGGVGLVYY